ncbi:hypothetical protein B296_00034842 [Ensete ventricosum]|uniref:Uncharacterized protein n=1 Tax=Ensete ventricosum TaxID=4639 RepID=A0A426Z7X9_ENSVE|nr:hypothetical protein B296_00034842 [Ensete ventricosum]
MERKRIRSDGLCRWAQLQVRGWTVLMRGRDAADGNVELETIRDDDPTFKPRRLTLLSFGEMRGTRAARSGNNADELLEYDYYEADVGRRKACWRPRLRRQHKNSEPSRRPTDDVSAKQAMSDLEEKRAIDIAAAGSSTPKAKTSRIPEHLSCPPAPKKRRVTGLRWSESTPPVPFFTSPDLDLFFLYALREISL